jgi:hypothetical protein
MIFANIEETIGSQPKGLVNLEIEANGLIHLSDNLKLFF